MMVAFDIMYLQDARKNLANCLDYVVNDQLIEGNYFMMVFSTSRYSKLFEKGNPNVVSGISGVELAQSILSEKMCIDSFKKRSLHISRTPEYWVGYYLAQYQWSRNETYSNILSGVGYNQIIKMYDIYHEMDEEHFNSEMDRLISLYSLSKGSTCHLQEIRKFNKLSQSELAKKSGVNIRTIREYEQNEKAVLKASYINLLKLANALYCDIDDLLPSAPTFVR